ncbi:hypothetical protein EV182_005768, partial [Spiromyces aspiralis]
MLQQKENALKRKRQPPSSVSASNSDGTGERGQENVSGSPRQTGEEEADGEQVQADSNDHEPSAAKLVFDDDENEDAEDYY